MHVQKTLPVTICGVMAILLTLSSTTSAQRDSPVWSCYLSPIEIRPKRTDATVKFTFHKVGGPHEHFEHQCVLLLYRKADEQEILDFINPPATVAKKNQKEVPFLEELRKRSLIVELSSKVAKRRSCDQSYCFDFEFDLKGSDLVIHRGKLAGYDPDNASDAGQWTWHQDDLSLIAFVPVNDSIYSTKVDKTLRQTHDFGRVMNVETSILYFKPLPYRLTLRTKGKDTTVLVH